MKLDLKINFSVILEITEKIYTYRKALETMQEALNRINGRLENENSGEAVTALVDKHKELQNEIESCKVELDTLYRLFDGFYNDMTSIIHPINYGAEVRVDRLDIYCNMKTMFLSISALKDLVSSGQTRLYFNYSSAYYTTSANPSITAEDKLKEENNYRKIEDIWDIIKQYGNWFEEGQEDIEYQFNKYVVAYEERDNDYAEEANKLYIEKSNVWDRTKNLGKDIYNLGAGVVNFGEDLLNLGEGIFQYVMGGTGYLISKVTGDTPSMFDYTESIFHEDNKKIRSVFNNPFGAVEDMSQQVSDEYEEKGAAHVVGHYGVPFFANKLKFKSITASATEGPTIRNRVLNNITESRMAREASDYKKFAEYEAAYQIAINKWKQGTPMSTINYEISANAKTHLIAEPVPISGKKGVIGTHNEVEFYKKLKSTGKDIKNMVDPNNIITDKNFPGIKSIEYRIPKGDGKDGFLDEYKFIKDPKTTYNPTSYTDEEMYEWGKEAMKNGYMHGYLILGEASNGMKFMGYFRNGEVTNFFPVTSFN
ncbi:CdiA family toxin C-terminal domain-containing protein [Clostridium sp. SHJSY1]|uniref:CdiA family toxin C-terminal domain-containing protein n=1 Tax=Clostridium sp. SHJSY1 TaxID=2942483 RepID=UPI002877021B|nr:CdiA family toxin C-terminal domain-containing protein [Clostridium sp. SHJSY1]MDS0527133.1 CdiA family toxin C-terminal domain-containing protein [Clostridium sp. SHJSY1]